jgi:hypothetical protein
VQVRELLAQGHNYESAARALGIPPGLAFMVGTGLPADDSDAAAPSSLLAGSPQDLINPPAHPERKQHVLDWVAERARRELHQPR